MVEHDAGVLHLIEDLLHYRMRSNFATTVKVRRARMKFYSICGLSWCASGPVLRCEHDLRCWRTCSCWRTCTCRLVPSERMEHEPAIKTQPASWRSDQRCVVIGDFQPPEACQTRQCNEKAAAPWDCKETKYTEHGDLAIQPETTLFPINNYFRTLSWLQERCFRALCFFPRRPLLLLADAS